MSTEHEHLTLPTGVGEVLKRIRDALDEHIGRVAADGQGWKLGGGTILAARWQHRTSEDLDILYHPDTDTTHFETRLGKALEAAGGTVIGWGLVSQIAFGREHQLELMANEPVPPVGHTRAMVDRELTTVLATPQIMNGKIMHRGLDPIGANLFTPPAPAAARSNRSTWRAATAGAVAAPQARRRSFASR